jgi:GT2 family glycosyltransferase
VGKELGAIVKPLYVCTVVFSRHDLLLRLFASAAASTRRPDGVFVVDHAYDVDRIKAVQHALDGIPLEIVTLDDPGGAHAGNWFLRNVPDDKVSGGDDIIFEPDALRIMSETPGDVVIPEAASAVPDGERTINPAACWIIRQSCVDKIGYWDERISPQYHYFDDSDYIRRMTLAGIAHTVAEGAHAVHLNGGSQTYRSYTPAQYEEHHRRFGIASANYTAKWGGPPFQETRDVAVEL